MNSLRHVTNVLHICQRDLHQAQGVSVVSRCRHLVTTSGTVLHRAIKMGSVGAPRDKIVSPGSTVCVTV